jgi:hypothetical protein
VVLCFKCDLARRVRRGRVLSRVPSLLCDSLDYRRPVIRPGSGAMSWRSRPTTLPWASIRTSRPSAFNPPYRRGGLRDALVKCCIKAILCDTIGPIRERRAAVTRDRDFVMNVLRAGAAIAREVTATTPAEVLAGLGLFTWS